MPSEVRAATRYVIRISLTDSEPLIWRRFSVPGDIPLDWLHDVIQIVMGWENCHAHSFVIKGKEYLAQPDIDCEDEADFSLCDLITRPRTKFRYEYDFGDSWEHELVVERIEKIPSVKAFRLAVSRVSERVRLKTSEAFTPSRICCRSWLSRVGPRRTTITGLVG